MFKLVAFALLTLLLAIVNGAPIFIRQAPPTNWDTDNLESYTDYQTRYLALGCQNQSNTQFFDDCCLPLKKRESLQNDRQSYCSPDANPSPGLPSNTLLAERDDEMEDGDNGDENDDDEDNYCDDDGSSSNESSSPTPTSTPSAEGPEPTPTPSPSPEASPDSTDTPTPSPTPSSTPSSGTPSDAHTGGDLTWFTQNGVAGACGTIHSDDDLVAALDSSTYDPSLCGKTISITWQEQTVDVVVADECPTCDNASSVDLSVAAFKKFADPSVGLLSDASWVLAGY